LRAQLVCAYVLGLYFTGARLLTQKAVCRTLMKLSPGHYPEVVVSSGLTLQVFIATRGSKVPINFESEKKNRECQVQVLQIFDLKSPKVEKQNS
jgi:hypothetical protein